MYKIKTVFLIALLLLGFTSEPGSKNSSSIIIATASSLRLPLEQIMSAFEKRYEIDVRLVSASSGVITAQILHGAPYDLFISADMKYPQKIYEKKLSTTAPETITHGSLVLWSNKSLNQQSFQQQIKSKDVQTIAIANPDLAPFGRAAMGWLQKKELHKKVESKLVFGKNVGQVNSIIHSGTADLAITATSAMYASQLSKSGYWQVVSSNNMLGIPHGALILDQIKSHKGFNPKASLFMDFLHSHRAKVIFNLFGYKSSLTPS